MANYFNKFIISFSRRISKTSIFVVSARDIRAFNIASHRNDNIEGRYDADIESWHVFDLLCR